MKTQREGQATYRGHSKVALEPSPDTVVNTLGLAPRSVQALEPVALVAHEALGACIPTRSSTSESSKKSIVGMESSLPASKGARSGGRFGRINRWRGSGLGKRTLLHDRDVLLSGNHLCGLLEQGQNGNIELAEAAGGSNCTLTVLLSGDGQIWRRHDQDLPWEKFQKLVPAGGLRVVRKLLRLDGQCAGPNPPCALAAGVERDSGTSILSIRGADRHRGAGLRLEPNNTAQTRREDWGCMGGDS